MNTILCTYAIIQRAVLHRFAIRNRLKQYVVCSRVLSQTENWVYALFSLYVYNLVT